ncbi:MAG: hypothetical protein RLY21_465 [Planctomycetota bacterium]
MFGATIVCAMLLATGDAAAAPSSGTTPLTATASSNPTVSELQQRRMKHMMEMSARHKANPDPTPEVEKQIEQELKQLADELVADVDFETLEAEALSAAASIAMNGQKSRELLRAACLKRAESPTVDGFVAAEQLLLLAFREQGDLAGAADRVLTHPALVDAYRSEDGGASHLALNFALAQVPAETLKKHSEAILAIGSIYDANPPLDVLQFSSLYLKVAKKALSEEQSDALRAKIVAAIEARLKTAESIVEETLLEHELESLTSK